MQPREGAVHEYDEQRVILYALGVGLGLNPTHPGELRFVAERDLLPLPSFVTVAAWDIGFKLELGIDWSKLIHAAQSFRIHRPLETAARLKANSAFVAAYAKPGRGTLLVDRTEIRDTTDECLIAELQSVGLARDFEVEGAPLGSPERIAPRPSRPPDVTDDMPTSPQAALLYRQLGGRSDIHWDPQTAREQGFDRPIMHGLCTFGHACHALLRTLCDYDPARLTAFGARFSSPVYPGERLHTHIWVDGSEVRFEVLALERDILVLADGHAELGT